MQLVQRSAERLGFGREWVLILYGAVIGTLTALGAVGFIEALHWTEHWCEQRQESWSVWLLPVLPMTGALITGLLVYYFAREASGHGVPQVIDSIARRGGRIPWKVGVVKVLASIATVGSGGSAGAEGPIVQIGSTSGSVFGSFFRVNRQEMSTLVGCGAAAGIASVFNAPIAGVFFVLEILLRDFSLKTFTPIVVASVFSTAMTQALLGQDEAIFAVGLGGYQFTFIELPSFILLGLVCVPISVGFSLLLNRAEDFFEGLKIHRAILPVFGAAGLGLLGIGWIFFMRWYGTDQAVPNFFGNGYSTIVALIDPLTYSQAIELESSHAVDAAPNGSPVPLAITALLLLTLFKAVGTTLTLGTGGSGGVFAPSLFVGATTGAAFGLVLERVFPFMAGASPASYALVGMASVIAGTTFAPLTAILLLFELTREPLVFLPAMLSSIIAAVGSHIWLRDSIYTMRLRQAGVRVGGGRDMTVMRSVPVSAVEITALPVEAIYPSDPLSKLIALHMPRTAPDFVVVDVSGQYQGMVIGEDLRTALVDREAIPLLLVAELLRTDLPTVHLDETLDTVLDKFGQWDVSALCLLAREGDTKPLGLITRANVIRAYNLALEEM